MAISVSSAERRHASACDGDAQIAGPRDMSARTASTRGGGKLNENEKISPRPDEQTRPGGSWQRTAGRVICVVLFVSMCFVPPALHRAGYRSASPEYV